MPVLKDRTEAGRSLAEKLEKFKGEDVIVLALPRGGVSVAAEVSKYLDAPMDIFIVRKLGAPINPELAVGAIAESGVVVVDVDTIGSLGITREDLNDILIREAHEMRRRAELYRNGREFYVSGRTAIVVDDGLATGLSAHAAIQALRRMGVEKIIFASPVCAKDTADYLRKLADEVICIKEPEVFKAVALWYENFPQVSDEEVISILNERIKNRFTGKRT